METRAGYTLRAEKDLRDAALYSHATRIVAGDFADCASADVIIITVGAPQQRDKSSQFVMKGFAG